MCVGVCYRRKAQGAPTPPPPLSDTPTEHQMIADKVCHVRLFCFVQAVSGSSVQMAKSSISPRKSLKRLFSSKSTTDLQECGEKQESRFLSLFKRVEKKKDKR